MKQIKILLFFVLFFITSTNKIKTQNVIITKNCEGTNFPFKNINVVAPDSVKRGDSIVFQIYGEADSEVEIFKLKIQASINNNLVYNKTEDTPYANLSEGDGYDYTHTQSVPIFAPTGDYSIRISLVDKNMNEVSCFIGLFSL